MKNRKCPNCKHHYGPWYSLRNLYFVGTFESWPCIDCRTALKFDNKRRLLNGVIIGLTLYLIFQLEDYVESTLLYILISLAVLLMVSTALFCFFDKIILAQTKH